jgi:hypothetical protein
MGLAMTKDARVNPDGSLFISQGPMTDDFRESLNRQASGMPPLGAVDVTARFNGEDVTVPVSVAREVLNKHMAELNRKVSSADSVPDPFQFAGNGNPYLAEQVRQRQIMEEMATTEIEQVKSELDKLGKLTDAEIVTWAVDSGHIGRSHMGHWVVM